MGAGRRGEEGMKMGESGGQQKGWDSFNEVQVRHFNDANLQTSFREEETEQERRQERKQDR